MQASYERMKCSKLRAGSSTVTEMTNAVR